MRVDFYKMLQELQRRCVLNHCKGNEKSTIIRINGNEISVY